VRSPFGGEGIDVVFWVVTPYGAVGGYHLFGGTNHLHLQGEVGGEKFLLDVGNHQ
jgi:hypothetical protein